MKILLDENIDVRLKLLFPTEMSVFTVKDMGWSGIKNGELMQLLSSNNFDFYCPCLHTRPCVIAMGHWAFAQLITGFINKLQ